MATRKAPAGKAVATRNTKTNLPANIDAEIAKEAEAVGDTLAGAGAGSFIRVDQDNGNLKHSLLGDAEPPQEFVVVDYRAQNTYYERGYVEGENSPPDCWAIAKKHSELAPDPTRIAEPEAESCKACPLNQYGTAHNGKGKACKNTYLVALLPPGADENTELAYLRVSPTGMKSFDGFANGCSARFKLPPIGAVVTVDTKQSGRGWTVNFGSFTKNPDYKKHWLRRAEAEAVLTQGWDQQEEEEVKKPAARKPAPRKAAPKKRAPARR